MRKADLGIDSARLSIDQQKIVILQLAAQLQRRSQIVEGERGLQAAAIDLSLFYRDAAGNPIVAKSDQLPWRFPSRSRSRKAACRMTFKLGFAAARNCKRLLVQRRQTKVDSDLGRNQLLPNVDMLLSFTQEGGSGVVKRGPQELRGSLVFELPFQRRVASGRLSQIDQRERFARDQITAEVQDAISAVQAYRRTRLITEELQVARKLEELERSRFELGHSNLFLVNLREQATFEAAIREAGAQSDYVRSLALYELAIAGALGRPAASLRP